MFTQLSVTIHLVWAGSALKVATAAHAWFTCAAMGVNITGKLKRIWVLPGRRRFKVVWPLTQNI